MGGIARESPEPYYQQLARIIEQDIRDGKYAVGERIPSETELCRLYDLSRSTVRETLRALEQQHLVKMVPRRGAYVSNPRTESWTLQVTQGFLETQSRSSGRAIVTRVLRWGVESLPELAANALDLPVGSSGFHLERIRSMDGQPALHSINWMPEDVGSHLIGKRVLEGQQSLNEALSASGLTVHAARREVAAVAAPREVAHYLDLKEGSPLLRIDSVSRDASGRAFDFYRSHVRSDIVTISVDAEARAVP
ncbi:MAG: GntR family transcriptional regulator [Rhizobiaceae bacterium]|nr:GntR family transcriptional regulator [Rhizobiaceae bacterium]